MNSYEKQAINFLRHYKDELNKNDFKTIFKDYSNSKTLPYYYLEKVLVNAHINFNIPEFKTGELSDLLYTLPTDQIIKVLDSIDFEVHYGDTQYSIVTDRHNKEWIKISNDDYDKPTFIDKENACNYIANSIYDDIYEENAWLYNLLFKLKIDGKDDERVKRLMNDEPIQSIPALHYDTETDIGEYDG